MVTDGWQTIFAVTNAIRHRGDAATDIDIKKRFFCAVSALFLNRLSPSRKSKLLIASMLSTDGDSDRCFATFFYQANPTSVSSNRLWFGACLEILFTGIKHTLTDRRIQKTAFYDMKNAVLRAKNMGFWSKKRRVTKRKTPFYEQKTAVLRAKNAVFQGKNHWVIHQKVFRWVLLISTVKNLVIMGWLRINRTHLKLTL